MKREALLLYIRELRDLEIAKITVENKFQTEMNQYDQSINELKTADHVEVPTLAEYTGMGPIIAIIIGICILCVIFFAILEGGGPSNAGFLVIIDGVAGLALIAGGIYCYKAGIEENLAQKEKRDAIVEYNRSEQERVKKNEPEIDRLTTEKEQRVSYWQDQYSKVNTLMERNYNLNILPQPYRNLAALIYIYDYMSTSQESLQDTFLHEHLENGIQRILAKLDTIIAQNRVLIFQNRILEAKSQTMIDQNSQMLSLMAQTEQNTSEAKQYAELAANYSEANAFFTLADYLKK